MKFKIGQLVKLKNPKACNAIFFRQGTTNLIIKGTFGNNNYTVYEKDKSESWAIGEDELLPMNHITLKQLLKG